MLRGRSARWTALLSGITLFALAIWVLLLPETRTERGLRGSAAIETPGYPDDWATTLDDATRRMPFEILLPEHELANRSNMTAVYVYPGSEAVALQFPSPAVPASPVRQEYLEVWESSWTGGDPLANFTEDVKQDPADGKAILDLDGLPALGVEAHSSSDIETANAAFLRFVLDGVDVQISGGESLDRLIDVARTILRSAEPSASPAGGSG